MTYRKILAYVSASTVTAMPMVAWAQVQTVSGLCEIFFRIVRTFSGVVFAVAVLMLLWAAFLFITQGGNEEKVKTARNYLIYALIGLAIATLAFFGDDIIINLTRGTRSFGECGALNI